VTRVAAGHRGQVRRLSLPIHDPCHEDWSAMAGDQRRRHCAACSLDVLNISTMTAEEAERAVAARRGERLCVRYDHDAAGDIVFARSSTLRRRGRAAAALATALVACTANPREEPEPPEESEALCIPDEEDPDADPRCDPSPDPPEHLFDVIMAEPCGLESSVVGTVMGVGVPQGVVMTPPTYHPVEAWRPRPQPRAPERGLPLGTWMGTVDPLPVPAIDADRPGPEDVEDDARRAAIVRAAARLVGPKARNG
jgi:hypothetical protein